MENEWCIFVTVSLGCGIEDEGLVISTGERWMMGITC